MVEVKDDGFRIIEGDDAECVLNDAERCSFG